MMETTAVVTQYQIVSRRSGDNSNKRMHQSRNKQSKRVHSQIKDKSSATYLVGGSQSKETSEEGRQRRNHLARPPQACRTE